MRLIIFLTIHLIIMAKSTISYIKSCIRFISNPPTIHSFFPPAMFDALGRGGELRVLRVREHPLNVEVHRLTAKSIPSK